MLTSPNPAPRRRQAPRHGNWAGQLVRPALPQPPRIKRRSLQHACHDGRASHLSAGLDRARHERQDRQPPRWSASPTAVPSFLDASSISLSPPPTSSTFSSQVSREVKVELMQSAATAGPPENGPCRSEDSRTNPPPPNLPITSSAAITRPRFCASPARPETGGSAFASSMTITTAPKNSPPKPQPPKAPSSWFVSIKSVWRGRPRPRSAL